MKYQSKWAEKFYARLISNSLEQGHITYLCSRFNQLFNDCNVRGVAYDDRNAARLEVERMMNACETLKPKCTPDHAAGGLKFLLNIMLTPKDEFRQTAKAKLFKPNDQIHLQECRKRQDYEVHLTEFIETTPNNQMAILPVYRLMRVRADGSVRCLHYAMSPWQSGGHFEITQHV